MPEVFLNIKIVKKPCDVTCCVTYNTVHLRDDKLVNVVNVTTWSTLFMQ